MINYKFHSEEEDRYNLFANMTEEQDKEILVIVDLSVDGIISVKELVWLLTAKSEVIFTMGI